MDASNLHVCFESRSLGKKFSCNRVDSHGPAEIRAWLIKTSHRYSSPGERQLRTLPTPELQYHWKNILF